MSPSANILKKTPDFFQKADTISSRPSDKKTKNLSCKIQISEFGQSEINKDGFMSLSANILKKMLDFPQKTGIFQPASQPASQSCARIL